MPAPRRGFTLIELLVVVSIIVLLIALLMPALARVKVHARVVACMSNVRSQSSAFVNFAQDHDGVFPTADQKTRWKLDALYVMDTEEGEQLNAYGLATNPPDGSTTNEIQTAWHCPTREDHPRLYIFNHSSGVLHVDHYMIQTGLPKAGDHGWSQLPARTPTRINSDVGVMTGDHTGVLNGQIWFTNHSTATGGIAGHNQGYSDGRVEWTVPEAFLKIGDAPVPAWNSGWPWYWAWLTVD